MKRTTLAVISLLLMYLPQHYAIAQTYPTKPIRLIAGSSAGSGIDLIARIVAHKLSEQLGQQIVVDPRAGVGGNLAAEIAAKAPPDGYTLLMGAPVHAINVSLYHTLRYDLLRDFAPISLLLTSQYVVVVPTTLPVKNIAELIALARAKPGQLYFGSAGTGNATHLAGELFNSLAGVNLIHVPYKGGAPAYTDLIAGQVQVMFGGITSVLQFIKSGRMHGLAVTGAKRTAIMPDLPTVQESGVPGYVAETWFGLLAPVAVPRPIIDRLNREVVTAMASPELRQRLAVEGGDPISTTPQQFGDFMKNEIVKWGGVIRRAKISAE